APISSFPTNRYIYAWKFRCRCCSFTGVVAQTTAHEWGQCGGTGWTGATTCPSGWVCTYSSEYYSQCLQGTVSSSSATAPAISVRQPFLFVADFRISLILDKLRALVLEAVVPLPSPQELRRQGRQARLSLQENFMGSRRRRARFPYLPPVC
ncbi:hypothetical protein DFH11DRAFT_1651682, partial [Phellopilus nigrolimitatus]